MRPVVLLIIPNLGAGGAQQVFRQHVKYYSTEFETISCSFNLDGALDVDHELPIISLDIPAGNNLVQKVINFFRRVIAVRRIKARHKVTLSVSHLEGADYVNILSGRGEKKILWIHGSKEHDKSINGWLGWIRKRWLLPFLYAKADALVCVSEALAKEMSDAYHLSEDKIATVYNGIDVDELATQRVQSVDNTLEAALLDKFVIVTHCRFASQKNLLAMLQLAASLRGSVDVKWLIIGDGALRAELISQCSSLNLAINSPWTDLVPNPQVYFLGYLANPFRYFRLSDLYIMTSLWEGFPLAICEAMACNLPVMAADCPTGPAEILLPDGDPEKACGFLMPMLQVGDQKALSIWRTTLENVIQDTALQQLYAERASARARDFTISVMRERIDKISKSMFFESH